MSMAMTPRHPQKHDFDDSFSTLLMLPTQVVFSPEKIHTALALPPITGFGGYMPNRWAVCTSTVSESLPNLFAYQNTGMSVLHGYYDSVVIAIRAAWLWQHAIDFIESKQLFTTQYTSTVTCYSLFGGGLCDPRPDPDAETLASVEIVHSDSMRTSRDKL